MLTARGVVAVVVAVLLAGCGARVSEEQVASIGLPVEQRAGAVGVEPRAPGSPGVDAAGAAGPAAASGSATFDGATQQQTTVVAAAASGERSGSSAGTGSPAPGGGGSTDVGVTDDRIVLGNVSTLSGPVPGLFRGAVIGTLAVIAYQNSKGGIHGRQLELDTRDDQFDTGQNRAQTGDLLGKAFALLGSFSVYDDAAAPEVERSGIPDVTYSLSGARRKIPNNFSVAPAEEGGTPIAPLRYYAQKFPEEIKAAGTLWGDVPISKASQLANEAAARSEGWTFLYSRGYQATETDFTADVIRMRQQGVKLVFLAGSEPKTLARIAKAMEQQGFEVPIVTLSIGYEHQLVDLAGDALDGMYTTIGYSLFAGEDAASVPEVQLMNEWLQKVKPGYSPDVYALFGWASGRLLFDAMEKVGPNLTRAAVNEALRTGGPFDANGMLASGDPGRKIPATCIVITRLQDGRFSRVDSPPTGYRCDLGGYFRSR